MNLTSAGVIKKLCKEYEIRPSKKWGQNFLIDRNILDKIIKASDLKKSDAVLEVGPGFGVLTQELAERVKKVVAVEIDKRLVEALEETTLKDGSTVRAERGCGTDLHCGSTAPIAIGDYGAIDKRRDTRCPQVKIINKDILKYDIKLKNYKIIANLPYQITGAVIRKFLELPNSPSLMVLMVQKEVAERICAKPGDMNLLAVSVQFFGKPEIISKVSKNSFWPVPKIDSAILRITPHSRTAINPKKFFEVVRAGFSQPRKQLKNNLKIESSILKKAGLSEKVRAEELSVEDWIKLTKILR